MTDLERFEAEQRRLAILELLAEDEDYTLNEDILQRGLEVIGLRTSTAKLRADLLHLKDHALVDIEIKGGDLYIVTVNSRGVDVAKGREKAPGVARPKPGRG